MPEQNYTKELDANAYKVYETVSSLDYLGNRLKVVISSKTVKHDEDGVIATWTIVVGAKLDKNIPEIKVKIKKAAKEIDALLLGSSIDPFSEEDGWKMVSSFTLSSIGEDNNKDLEKFLSELKSLENKKIKIEEKKPQDKKTANATMEMMEKMIQMVAEATGKSVEEVKKELAQKK